MGRRDKGAQRATCLKLCYLVMLFCIAWWPYCRPFCLFFFAKLTTRYVHTLFRLPLNLAGTITSRAQLRLAIVAANPIDNGMAPEPLNYTSFQKPLTPIARGAESIRCCGRHFERCSTSMVTFPHLITLHVYYLPNEASEAAAVSSTFGKRAELVM